MRVAAQKSLKCIQRIADADGLTWANPNKTFKYFMDNVEVYAGLASAQKFFTATGDTALAQAAGDQNTKVGKGLKTYWETKVRRAKATNELKGNANQAPIVYEEVQEKKRFAWALDGAKTFTGGMEKLYPNGLAQLFGVAFVVADPVPFAEVVKAFPPETVPNATGAERYLIAASRLGGVETTKWRARVVAEVEGFTTKNVYIYRPGLVVLGLLEGAYWMPNPASGN